MAVAHRLKKNVLQYAKFNVISFGNWIIDFGLLNLLLWLWPTTNGFQLLVYNSIAYVGAVANSYFWNSRITFKQQSKRGYREKALFALQAGVSFIINNLVFLLGVKGLSMFLSSMWLVDNVAKELSVFCSSTASFFFMKWFVFRKKNGH
ncbi:MAG TPA: GtrA family protein [Bacillales bacterium]|nr:GtrA family protein [Bacillales bacterium]